MCGLSSDPGLLTMASALSMLRPVCLIENEGNNLVVNTEAKKILSKICEPVTVVAIVGKYRTGKSFLMNRLAGCNSGFPLGSSIQSKTKGIWMWCVPHPQRPGHVLVLLDTEGLGDVEKGDSKNDGWIFSLSVLLSSALVYNSMGTIDQQAMEQLHYVTELTKMIKGKSSDAKGETAENETFLPSFTWCVRDFTLILERDGKEITEDEYLMMGLELKEGHNMENYNLPRRCLQNFFQSHKCFVFDRPTSKRNLHCLDEILESELDEDFVGQAARFYRHIMENSRTKTLTGGIKVTGKMLGHLTSLYVDIIQSGAVPCMENAVLALAETENIRALEDALSRYECDMGGFVHLFPTEVEEEFVCMHMACERQATDVFLERSLLDTDLRYLHELKTQIEKKKADFMKMNEDLSRDVCANLLKNLSLSMQEGLVQGRYTRPRGHRLYLRDKQQFLEMYDRTPGKGVKALEMLQNFICDNESIEAAILHTAERMAQVEEQKADSPVMERPVCLIENHEDGTIQVNQAALEILSAITQKVVVVAIVGKYRTGKSYLMNRLAGRKNGFSLGATVQSMTKGIWMWCVPHPVTPEHTLVLLDTEGLGDVEKGNSQNDSWIFALAVLLSSTLVYNSMGTIDQQAMEQLHYVTELTEKIKLKSSEQEELQDDSSEFKRIFPSFIWCVRDFTLQLQLNGKEITEDEYLKNALKLKSGLSEQIRNYNLPRECLRHFFHSHKCFVFDRPASKDDLQNLDNMEESQLNPTFVQQTRKFCKYIYENNSAKTLSGGYTITGRGLGDIAVSYVESIRSGSIPSLENAVVALAKIENSRAIEEALSKYEEMMTQYGSKFPTETQEEFLSLDKECHSQALKVFMKLSFKDDNQVYQLKLLEALGHKKATYLLRNEEASETKCRVLLQELSVSLEEGIREGKFSVPGGYKIFLEEKKSLEENYLKVKGKGVKALEILQGFLKEKEMIESTILKADKTLQEKEKMLAEQRSQAEAATRDKEILEKANMELRKKLENEEEVKRMHEAMLETKMREEREKMKAENEWLIQQKLKEQEVLLTKGFDRRAQILEMEMKYLRPPILGRPQLIPRLVGRGMRRGRPLLYP
ncbi:guanylate-binding protein 3-like isoform 2-T2 [Leptodactylus fuscus]